MVETIPKEKARLKPEGIEQRSDFLYRAKPLRLEQNSQNSDRPQAETACGTTRLLLVEQNQVRLQLDGKRKSFGFAPVEVPAKDDNQILIGSLLAPNP